MESCWSYEHIVRNGSLWSNVGFEKEVIYPWNIGCFSLASLVRPQSAPVRLNSFDGAHPGQPPVPCSWSGSLGGDLRCMLSPQEGECDRSISSWQGLTRVSTVGSTLGSLSNAPIKRLQAWSLLLGIWKPTNLGEKVVFYFIILLQLQWTIKFSQILFFLMYVRMWEYWSLTITTGVQCL